MHIWSWMRTKEGSSINKALGISTRHLFRLTGKAIKKGGYKSRPRNLMSLSLFAHRFVGLSCALEHLHAHHMDRVLVRVHVGAQLNMMTVVSLELFWIHHVPALSVLVANELNLVTFSLHRPLQRHEGRLGRRLVRRLGHGVLLSESGHAHHEGQSQQTNHYLFH